MHNPRLNTQYDMKNPVKIYVAINLSDFSVITSKTKDTIASYVGIHRNTLTNMPDRVTYNNWLIVITTLK